MNRIERLLLAVLLLAGNVTVFGQLAERTERASSANNTPKKIAEDKCKAGGMNYFMDIYDNGEAVVSDELKNWFVIKTENQVNSFTGEKSNKLVSVYSYVAPNSLERRDVPLIKAYKVLNEKYDVLFEGNKIALRYKPLGITYLFVGNNTPSSWLGINEVSIKWYIIDNFKNCKGIFGLNNRPLYNLTSLRFKDIGGKVIPGGYYDKETNNMYYVGENIFKFPYDNHGHMVRLYCPSGDVFSTLANQGDKTKNMQLKIDSLTKISNEIKNKTNNRNLVLKKISADEYKRLLEKDKTINQEINNLKNQGNTVDNVTAIYCIPSDEIVNVVDNDKTAELHYKNGDYVKISKLKSGLVYDCSIHRANGIWKVKLDNNNPNSEYVFTNGNLEGFVYKDQFVKGLSVNYLSCLDFLSVGMMKENPYYPRIFDTAKNQWVHVLPSGEIKEYKEEAEKARLAALDAEKHKKEYAAYQVLCQKYGKTNVDELFNNHNIKVGMPFSMIRDLCLCRIDLEGEGYKWYDVLYAGSYLDEDENVYKPSKTFIKALTRQFWIRVEGGKVTFVSHMKIY